MRNVKDKAYGAVGNGVADDTAAIQAAINSGSGEVLFPAGTYKANLSVSNNSVYLVGEGRGASNIAGGIVFNGVAQGGIHGLSVNSNGIHVINSHNVELDKFSTSGGQYGVRVSGGPSQFLCTISNFEIDRASIAGIYLGGDKQVADIFINNGIAASCGTGLLMDNCSGIYVSDIDVISSRGCAIKTLPIAGVGTSALFFNDVLTDTSILDGFCFDSAGGLVADVNLVNCWSATNVGSGVYANKVDGMLVSGTRIINNKRHGIHLAGGQNYSLTGNQIGMNSMEKSGAYHGIMSADGVQHLSIIGNRIGGPLGQIGLVAPNMQGYGIDLGQGWNVICKDNNLVGNVLGGLNDHRGGANRIVRSNIPPAIVMISMGENKAIPCNDGLVAITGAIDGHNFKDIVLWQPWGQTVVLTSVVYGNPPMRNYAGGNLELHCSLVGGTTGTYGVTYENIGEVK